MASYPNAIANQGEHPNVVAMQQVQQQQQVVVAMSNVTQVEQNHITIIKNDESEDDKDGDDAIIYLVLAIIFFAITIFVGFFYLVFIVCKFLVTWMIVEENISVQKPESGSVVRPVLDLTLRFLFVLSTKFENLTHQIQDNLIIIFFIRVMITEVFDLVIILYLNIVHPITFYWVLYMVINIAFCTIMVISVILNFCCKNQLDSTCKRLDAINHFNTMFLQFKMFSFLSSLILMINALVLIDQNSLVSFFIFVTALDVWFLLLTFIAMIIKSLRESAVVADVPQQPE